MFDNNSYIIILQRDKGYIAISDTKEKCYVSILKFLQKEGIRVYQLQRSYYGNSHDENWGTEHTLIKKDHPDFQNTYEQLTHVERGAYWDDPIIEVCDELNEEIIEHWSKPFTDNEETTRYIEAIRYNEACTYSLEKVFIDSLDSFPHQHWMWSSSPDFCAICALKSAECSLKNCNDQPTQKRTKCGRSKRQLLRGAHFRTKKQD